MLGGGEVQNCQKKFNIDYFGYAVNLEFKFKLNFDQEKGSKIEKMSKFKKKLSKNLLNLAIIYKEKLI